MKNLREIVDSMIKIQAQDEVGQWMDHMVTINDSKMILDAMKSVKATFPNKRVRAVDASGRLVDNL